MMNGQKQHISSFAQLTSQLNSDIPPESVLNSTVGCMDAGCTAEGFLYRLILFNSYRAQKLSVRLMFTGGH